MVQVHNETLHLTNGNTSFRFSTFPDRVLRLNDRGMILSNTSILNGLCTHDVPENDVHLSTILPPDVVEQMMQAIQKARETHAIQSVEYHVAKNNDGRCSAHIHEAMLFIAADDACICLIRDITERHSMMRSFRESQERLQLVVSHAPIILYAIDTNGIFTLAEGKALDGLGLCPGESIGRSIFERYKHQPEIIDAVQRALQGEYVSYMSHISLADGTSLVYEVQMEPLYDEKKQIHGVIGLAIDVTQREQARQELQARERRFRTLTEHASDLVLILDAMGIYRYASPSHKHILGYEPNELIGTCIFDLMPTENLARALEVYTHALQIGVLERDTCRLRRTDGSYINVEYSGYNCFDDPNIGGFVINAFDITQRVTLEHTLRYQALHDSLTGLPNRTQLIQRLEQRLEEVQRRQPADVSKFALLTMDIDRFKEINDTFGHHLGDILLQQVGERVRTIVAEPTLVARLGGDEFAALIPNVTREQACAVMKAIRKTLEESFVLDGFPVQAQASIGAALYPEHGEDALTLLRHADIAMYEAKREHEGYLLYDSSHDRYNPRRLAMIGALRQAIARNELRLYYQPKVDLRTKSIHSVEALVRWQHPDFGFVPPDQFIPLAEQTGLITQLTFWVLKTAICQCREWMNAGLHLSIAVNLSMWDIREVSLPDTIAKLLMYYEVPPQFLRVELTESTMMMDIERSLSILSRISNLGIQVSIDDFGTGYSSLAYLKRLPINELKIDRSFIQHITDVEIDATIVRSTVMMAHSLGLQVVAEGVESEAATHLLSDIQCDLAQGYYISRPVPAPALENWLHETKMIAA